MGDLINVLSISLGLAMDAFAVSITNSLTKPKLTKIQFISYPICFGVMQAVMPLIGFFVGTLFIDIVQVIDHWIALVILGFIGIKMIIENIKAKDNGEVDTSAINTEYRFGEMIIQGVATSIDALVVGITLGLTLSMNIYLSVLIIGVITFILSLLGMFIGKKAGKYLADYAGIIGGIILLGIGIKIFLEHIL